MVIEEKGIHFESNSKKLNTVSDVEWTIALKQASEHLELRMRNRTRFGAHTVENLGVPAKEYYLNFSYMSIIYGRWEWKDEYTLPQQLIRIINSTISTVIESFVKAKTKNLERLNEGRHKLTTSVETRDVESMFYGLESVELDEESLLKDETEYNELDDFVRDSGDSDFQMFWECVKEGCNRRNTSELMDLTPRQLDKFKERFLRQAKKHFKDNGKQ